MREHANQHRIREVVEELGRRATGAGRVYLVGGSSVVLHYSQALAKLERGHLRDLADVAHWEKTGKIEKTQLWRYFGQIVPLLLRYPRIDQDSFATRVKAFLNSDDETAQRDLLRDLPGEEIVVPGLAAIGRGDVGSAEALLVLMGSPRMIACGFSQLVEPMAAAPTDLEHRLYDGLAAAGEPDPYGRYNSLKSRLNSFLSALEARWGRGQASRIAP